MISGICVANRHLIINAPDNWNITQENSEKLGKDIDCILEVLGKKAEKLGKRLGKNRIEIIRLIYQTPTISSIEMANHIGISPTAIDNNIRQMRDIFIRRVGPRNGGHWEIITETV